MISSLALRFCTLGMVDDGKSTLVGRLLFDSRQILRNELQSLACAKSTNDEGLDFARLTDGLRAERELGITIDVAYRYFSTPNRRFTIADSPGHIPYTRNAITGASTAQVALLVVDIEKGLREQTRHHAFLCSLLGVPQLVVCLNKMDRVGFSAEAFSERKEEFRYSCRNLRFRQVQFIPTSALYGDGVVEKSERMPWYEGPSLLQYLEQCSIANEQGVAARFPVQYVIQVGPDYRALAGRIATGTFRAGDQVAAFPSGLCARLGQIHTFDGVRKCATAPLSINLLLEGTPAVNRGDIVADPNHPPRTGNELPAIVCWLGDQRLRVGQELDIKQATATSKCTVGKIHCRLDGSTQGTKACGSLGENDVGAVTLSTKATLAFDRYEENRITGSFILIDPITKNTVGAGMIQ